MDETKTAPKVATIYAKVRYVIDSMQKTHDAGINPFAVQLLAEGLGDANKLTDGGVMFIWPFDHQKRPVWVIITGQAPFVASVEMDATDMEADMEEV